MKSFDYTRPSDCWLDWLWEEHLMVRLFGMAILLASVAGFAFAGAPLAAPEIDVTAGVAALGLVSGGLLILRSRKRKS